MTMPRTNKLPGFEGVNAGNTATLRIPRGFTYHQLKVEYSGVTLAQLTEIRVVINGDVKQRYKGADFLDKYNQYEGRNAASGIFVLDFNRYNLRTRDAEETTALGTGAPEDPTPINSLSLEIDIDSGATSPSLKATARRTGPRFAGLVKEVKNFVYSPASSGEFDIVDLPRGPLINKIVLQNADITRVQIERDDTVIFDRTKAENELEQSDGVRVPDTDWFVVDPTELGNGSDSIITDGVQSLNVKLFMSAGGQVPVLVEYLAPID